MDNKSTGLGDTIEKITTATGIKQVIKRFTKATGIDCGCDKRKEILNEMFPYQKPACMNRAQHSVWQDFKENRGQKITSPEQEMVARMHSDLFHHKFTKPCTCSPKKWNEWIRDIDRIFDTYGKTTTKQP
jgi:hypothetical protein